MRCQEKILTQNLRTLTMDNKYQGAVTINVWPGYAVQIVKKTGEHVKLLLVLK